MLTFLSDERKGINTCLNFFEFILLACFVAIVFRGRIVKIEGEITKEKADDKSIHL